jgi:hypothetical protein
MAQFPKTPELDKQKKLLDSGAPQVVQEFIDWMSEQGYAVCDYRAETDDEYEGFFPISGGSAELQAQFFEVDLDKIESERRALLDYLQAKHDAEAQDG